jgi:hypothetical protein
VYDTPPVAVKVVLDPLQMVGLAAVAVMVGLGNTFTVTVVEFTHPLASVPVTVYVVFTSGLAVTVVPVVADKPVAGLQT